MAKTTATSKRPPPVCSVGAGGAEDPPDHGIPPRVVNPIMAKARPVPKGRPHSVPPPRAGVQHDFATLHGTFHGAPLGDPNAVERTYQNTRNNRNRQGFSPNSYEGRYEVKPTWATIVINPGPGSERRYSEGFIRSRIRMAHQAHLDVACVPNSPHLNWKGIPFMVIAIDWHGVLDVLDARHIDIARLQCRLATAVRVWVMCWQHRLVPCIVSYIGSDDIRRPGTYAYYLAEFCAQLAKELHRLYPTAFNGRVSMDGIDDASVCFIISKGHHDRNPDRDTVAAGKVYAYQSVGARVCIDDRWEICKEAFVSGMWAQQVHSGHEIWEGPGHMFMSATRQVLVPPDGWTGPAPPAPSRRGDRPQGIQPWAYRCSNLIEEAVRDVCGKQRTGELYALVLASRACARDEGVELLSRRMVSENLTAMSYIMEQRRFEALSGQTITPQGACFGGVGPVLPTTRDIPFDSFSAREYDFISKGWNPNERRGRG